MNPKPQSSPLQLNPSHTMGDLVLRGNHYHPTNQPPKLVSLLALYRLGVERRGVAYHLVPSGGCPAPSTGRLSGWRSCRCTEGGRDFSRFRVCRGLPNVCSNSTRSTSARISKKLLESRGDGWRQAHPCSEITYLSLLSSSSTSNYHQT